MSDEIAVKIRKKTRPTAPSDLSLQTRAMRRIDAALAPLDDDGKRAVLAWLNSRELNIAISNS
jgi:hypothetical protein